jgi:coenzyme PQQ precursor peptide PqqA
MRPFLGAHFSVDEIDDRLYTVRVGSLFSEGMEIMEWTAPKFEEVALNCEINSYASAAL